MSRLSKPIKVRLTQLQITWVEIYQDREGVTRSEAIREAVRRLHMTTNDEVLKRLAANEQEVELLKRRVARLESEVRTRDKQRKRLSRMSIVRYHAEDMHEKERQIAKLGGALDDMAATVDEKNAQIQRLVDDLENLSPVVI